ALGLSNPIRVEQAGDGYELIQGYRRLTAYRELLADTKDPIYATIPAAINASGETVQQLYRRMVDENLVRRDISFGEMAQLALSYHNEDPQVGSIEAAIALLYASSGRQRRHYIRQFARLLEQIGEHLAHVDTLPRALGLDVLKRIDDRPKEIRALAVMLAREPQRTAEDETRILKAYLLRKPVRPKSVAQKTAKTTFRLNRPEGAAKCTAADGRLELQLDRDFSAIERQRLEAAVEAFFNQLDEDSGDSVPAGTD
ncbi:MAG: replication protein, partial [Sedimentitalea sp.]